MSRTEQISTFCSVLIGGPSGDGDDRLVDWSTYVWTLDQGRPRPAKTTHWVAAQPQPLAEAVGTQALRQPDQIAAVYTSIGMAPTAIVRERVGGRAGSDAPMHRRRFEADDVLGIPALWADLDILGAGHAGTGYPPDVDSALRIAHSLGIPPTMIVHSGGGLQAYWCFHEPWLATEAPDQAAEQRAMAELSRDLVNSLRWHAQRLGGWTVDSVFNLDRVMRAPGSLNTKGGSALPVKLISAQSERRRYDPDEIREYLAPAEELEAFAQRSLTGGRSVEELAAALPGLNLNAAWDTVARAPEHTPEWLTEMMDSGLLTESFDATWRGERPDLAGDQNRFDAAIVRTLANLGASAQRQAEAMMARRVRSGVNVDKVDPRVRADYVVRTLANIADAVAAAKAETARRVDSLERATRAAVTATIPAPPVVAEESSATREPAPQSAGSGVDDDSPPWDEPAPLNEPPTDEPPPDEFADEVAKLLEEEEQQPGPQPEPAAHPPHLVAVATETVRADRVQAAEPVAVDPGVDLWGERPEGMVSVLDTLGEVLLPDPYRERGVKIWHLEQRDRGPAAMGRLVLWLPADFDWPSGVRPDLYRPGKPFYTEWRPRREFETPVGYRRSIEHDAKIVAQPVAAHQADWPQIISAMVPYWMADSSGTDLATQMHEWLYDYLISRAPVLVDTEAQLHGHPWLADHAEWGVRGAPTIMISAKSFLDYVAIQPGGRTGREARSLLSYLHTTERRPRIETADGKMTRGKWLEIDAVEFRRGEWDEIVRNAQEVVNARTIRLLQGGRSEHGSTGTTR